MFTNGAGDNEIGVVRCHLYSSGCDEEVVGQPPRLDHLRCLSDDDDEDKDDDNVLRS